MSYLLETRELTKRYKKQYANDKLNMCVEEGCIYGLLGPNGAGKSTLLKMITGMAEPTSGSTFFSGEVMTRKDLTPLLLEIESIKERDLLFVSEKSDIREFNEVLSALHEMKI